MATNIETMWVGDQEHLQRTVQNLVSRGGVVQGQTDTEASIAIKKKINVPVLVVGLVLCLVPGLAYLVWYLTADQNQQVTVKVGSPDSIKTDHQHWYDSDGTPRPGDAAPDSPSTPAAPAATEPPGLGVADPLREVPPLPTASPEAAPAIPPPPPAPPVPPGGTSF